MERDGPWLPRRHRAHGCVGCGTPSDLRILKRAICGHVPTLARGKETPDVGVRIAIQEYGTPSGHALLLVHGLLGSHLSWAKQTSDPALQKYRIISYDLRGHGFSGSPSATTSYSDGKLWADELKTVIETKHLDHPVIVGWSLGGLVLSDYLRLYGDEKLGGLVFVDGVIETQIGISVSKAGYHQFADIGRSWGTSTRNSPICSALLPYASAKRHFFDPLGMRRDGINCDHQNCSHPRHLSEYASNVFYYPRTRADRIQKS